MLLSGLVQVLSLSLISVGQVGGSSRVATVSCGMSHVLSSFLVHCETSLSFQVMKFSMLRSCPTCFFEVLGVDMILAYTFGCCVRYEVYVYRTGSY